MCNMITSTKYAEIFEENPAKVKRHVREFLGPDESTGQRKGFARQLTVEDSFKIYLGAHMVGQLGLSIAGAKKVISDLWPWLKKHGFLPIVFKATPAGWHVEIRQAGDTFYYTARKQIEFKKLDEKFEGMSVFLEKWAQVIIKNSNEEVGAAIQYEVIGNLYISHITTCFAANLMIAGEI